MKNRTEEITRTMMCKLSRRHFNKLEAMQARHHLKDATNITLPSLNYLVFQQIRSSTC